MPTLLLRLAAPMQAWGIASNFDTRKMALAPTKSGVIGLLAAALGIRRDAPERLTPLNQLRFGVRTDRAGSLLVDFHTAGNLTPLQKKQKLKETPYITRRHYLADAVFLVGLESTDRALLEQLADALQSPAYPLFLGRRSCPPTLPLCLGIRDVDLVDSHRSEPALASAAQLGSEKSVCILLDADPLEPNAFPQRDLPLSFDPRHRRFGYRAVKELRFSPQEPVSSTTQHDPFAELGGA